MTCPLLDGNFCVDILRIPVQECSRGPILVAIDATLARDVEIGYSRTEEVIVYA
jgi:hypothetical protein